MKIKGKSASQRRAENRERMQNARSANACNPPKVVTAPITQPVASSGDQALALSTTFEQQYSFHDFDPTTA